MDKAYYKAMAIIDSCITVEHMTCANRYVKNFGIQYPEEHQLIEGLDWAFNLKSRKLFLNR